MSANRSSTSILLTISALLLAGNLLLQLAGSGSANRAFAGDAPKQGIPDSGAQFQAMVDKLTELNAKFDKLQSFFESGKLTVKVAKEETK